MPEENNYTQVFSEEIKKAHTDIQRVKGGEIDSWKI